MFGKMFWAFLATLSMILIASLRAEGAFKSTPERWTIKIRGDRKVAERIARERGFEVYHEFKELPGIFTLQKKIDADEPAAVTISQNFEQNQSEIMSFPIRSHGINIQPKTFKFVTKNLRRFLHRIRKLLRIP